MLYDGYMLAVTTRPPLSERVYRVVSHTLAATRIAIRRGASAHLLSQPQYHEDAARATTETLLLTT